METHKVNRPSSASFGLQLLSASASMVNILGWWEGRGLEKAVLGAEQQNSTEFLTETKYHALSE